MDDWLSARVVSFVWVTGFLTGSVDMWISDGLNGN